MAQTVNIFSCDCPAWASRAGDLSRTLAGLTIAIDANQIRKAFWETPLRGIGAALAYGPPFIFRRSSLDRSSFIVDLSSLHLSSLSIRDRLLISILDAPNSVNNLMKVRFTTINNCKER
ncbi:MAG TPA: hypothetical protein VKZ53_23290 [Candidatus Angelobacter sp.]|nr:hypothetical protein [Candidatus Angelobacter sp.]